MQAQVILSGGSLLSSVSSRVAASANDAFSDRLSTTAFLYSLPGASAVLSSTGSTGGCLHERWFVVVVTKIAWVGKQLLVVRVAGVVGREGERMCDAILVVGGNQ